MMKSFTILVMLLLLSTSAIYSQEKIEKYIEVSRIEKGFSERNQMFPYPLVKSIHFFHLMIKQFCPI